ncbi:MAG: tetratricopeptide repeat protein [Methylococcaceae bacterium]|nr:tetratricopeptide repeat protein [Methylococcaceae bacterium]
MPRALARHKAQTALVIPIKLRPCDTDGARFMHLQCLPKNFLAVTEWPNTDAAYADIAARIRAIITKHPKPPTPPAQLFHIPYDDAHGFYFDPKQHLAQLHSLLGSHARVAVCGLGGVGKTRLASHYASHHRADYSAVLWLSALSADLFAQDYAQLALRLGGVADKHEQQCAYVYHWLSTHTQWLLVIDNADDPASLNSQLLQGYLPQPATGKVLITSQLQTYSAERYFACTCLSLHSFTDQHGSQYLQQQLKLADAELASARALSNALGGLPLALAHACAYIRATQCGLAGYLSAYQQHRHALLNPENPLYRSPDHDLPVYATLQLSLGRLPETSIGLLQHCALLHYPDIPEEVLCAALNLDEFALNTHLQPALQYHLIQRDPSQHSLSLHRLVQQVLVWAMPEADQRVLMEHLVAVLDGLFPKPGKVENWPNCERLTNSGLACAQGINTYNLATVTAAHLLNQLGYYLNAKAYYALALPLFQQALDIYKSVLGDNHPDTATSLNNLAALYKTQGDYAQALPLYQQALDIRKTVLGDKHPDTASSLNNLAALYESLGDYTLALPLYQQALDIRKTVLGDGHPDTASSLNNLALLYKAQGDYAQALPLYQQALDIRKTILGDRHPNTASSLNNLAGLYKSLGDYAQALPLYQQALDIKKTVLGDRHPTTASSLNNLAGLYYALGDYAQALPLYQQALDIRKAVLGDGHPDTAGSLNNLAYLYDSLGDYAQALPLYAQALKIFQQVLGEAHPTTKGVAENYRLAQLQAAKK